MVKAIIADTTPLYALIDSSDQYYQIAREQLLKIQQLNIQVIVSSHILLESYSLILYRLGIDTAIKFSQEIRNSAELIHPNDADYQLAYKKIQLYSDQKITLFDAVTASISQRLNYPVWTYDHHFNVMLIPVWS